jgi:glucose/arabinose dehydrogenase
MKTTLAIAVFTCAALPASAAVLTGPQAFGDWRSDAPGVVRKITVADMPKTGVSPIGVAPPSIDARPAGAELKTLPGFHVSAFAKLEGPRLIRVAPNGDIFVSEGDAGRIIVLRAQAGAEAAATVSTFAQGLAHPFGIAFYPQGPNPQWVYIANTNSVVRFPYRNGDLTARGAPETIVSRLTQTLSDHWTRDILFSPDGKRMFVSVGSGSNAAEGMPKKTPDEVRAWQADHALGAAWDIEVGRADVIVGAPDGAGMHVFAAGIRNCVGMALQPQTHDLWCSTNERDLLGDDLPPDYVTRVHEAGFYGWPWFYIGDHEDPRHAGERPDLADKITIPDVLIQPHSAPLQMAFYDARSGPAVFPAEYRGDAFVALHGSWNRAKRTGYKVVRLHLNHGVPDGTYEDFLTGFVIGPTSVWGRPVGVAVANDGALLVADDGSDEIWRVAYAGQR